jgi:hypothetical protein
MIGRWVVEIEKSRVHIDSIEFTMALSHHQEAIPARARFTRLYILSPK